MPEQLKKYEMERRRGLILYLLYISRPKSLELGSLMYLLDARNYPITRHRLAEDLDFLRDNALLRITTPSSQVQMDAAQQERFLHRFSESDGDDDNTFCAKLTSKGLQFQEGNLTEMGVQRVS